VDQDEHCATMTVPESPLRGRRALVLGASGFIGRWVTRELVRRGAHVVAQVRSRARLPADVLRAAEPVEAELAEPGIVTALVRDTRPDVAFNLVGYGVAKEEREPGRYARLNSELVDELLLALAREGDGSSPRLIHVGSALECGDSENLDELAPSRPNEPYGASKAVATRRLRDGRERTLALVARAFTVFGLGERPGRLVPTLLASRATSGPIALSAGTQARDFVYVEDLARALVELAELDGPTVRAGRYPFDAPCLNLASGALTPVREFVLALADAFAIPRGRLAFGALPQLQEEMHHPPVPIERLRAALGWSPSRDPRAGLARMAARLAEGPA
jgi:nucleoside-diphosphate-sugar epimerase